jgi:transcriptional regulator with XRE-family HTH domain
MTTELAHVVITVPARHRLRLRREARNQTLEEVAAELGLTRQALRRLELGENVTISPAVVTALAAFYEVPESEIYQDVTAAIDAAREKP